MRIITKLFIVFACVLGVVMIISVLAAPFLDDDTRPVRIPSYDEVVSDSFSTNRISNIVDIRDAAPLIDPLLPTVKLSRSITSISCPTNNTVCMYTSLYRWVKSGVEYRDALLQREFIMSPEEAVLYRYATSESKALLLASLLRAQNFDVRVGATPYSHFVELRDVSVRLDPGCGSCLLGETRYRGDNESIAWVE